MRGHIPHESDETRPCSAVDMKHRIFAVQSMTVDDPAEGCRRRGRPGIFVRMCHGSLSHTLHRSLCCDTEAARPTCLTLDLGRSSPRAVAVVKIDLVGVWSTVGYTSCFVPFPSHIPAGTLSVVGEACRLNADLRMKRLTGQRRRACRRLVDGRRFRWRSALIAPAEVHMWVGAHAGKEQGGTLLRL